jgi:ParB family chromosome partitioning protein
METIADRAGVKLRREGIILLNPQVIEPDPTQPRKLFDEASLQRLAGSIKKVGQLTPVMVRQEGGRYILVAGERRWRAIIRAGIPQIRAEVFRGGNVKSIQILENLQREDLSPIEKANAYRDLMAENEWSIRELAKELNLEHSRISRAIKLLDLATEHQEKVHDGSLKPTTAYAISKHPAEKQAALVKAAVAGTIKGADVRKAVEQPRPILTLGGGSINTWSYSRGRMKVTITGHTDRDSMLRALEGAIDSLTDEKQLRGGKK